MICDIMVENNLKNLRRILRGRKCPILLPRNRQRWSQLKSMPNLVEIYVAAKRGEPDPELNTALRFSFDQQAQVPKHVIDKAIDKAKRNTDETFTEGRYEGFGPNGSMLTLILDVKRQLYSCQCPSAFGKNGGNMGSSGSVSYPLTTKVLSSLLVMMPMPSFELLLEADGCRWCRREGTITVLHRSNDLHKRPLFAWIRCQNPSNRIKILNQKLSCQWRFGNIWKNFTAFLKTMRTQKITQT